MEEIRDRRYYRGTFDDRLRFNYKMQNLHAALGRSQLARLPALLERRRAIADRCAQVLESLGCPPSMVIGRGPGSIDHRFALRLPASRRDDVMRELQAQGIPSSTEVAFLVEPDPQRWPNASQLSREILTLPTYPTLSDGDVDRIVDGLGRALRAVLVLP